MDGARVVWVFGLLLVLVIGGCGSRPAPGTADTAEPDDYSAGAADPHDAPVDTDPADRADLEEETASDVLRDEGPDDPGPDAAPDHRRVI